MNDQDYIRKAVELADGWQTTRLGDQRVKVFVPHGDGGDHPLRDIGSLHRQWVLDALAAQLVRQVDNSHYVDITWMTVEVRNGETGQRLSYVEYRGTTPPYDDCCRTMNTIKAVVDSKVLE